MTNSAMTVPPSVDVKICGLDRPESVDAAVAGGARYTGFVFYPPSPRNLSAREAGLLTCRVPAGVLKVGLFVDPEDDFLSAVLDQNQLDMIQLHGNESAARVGSIKQASGLPVIKAVSLAGPEDLKLAADYTDIADRIIFDAKPPADMKDALPGGNALSFDWQLLADAKHKLPWMLAGGLTAENLAEAVGVSGANSVDVSSGVEEEPGIKSLEKITSFLAAAKRI